VRRQRLDITPLTLGEDRVERERRLAGAGDAGDDHELVAGDDDVDVLEIVLASAADDDGVHVGRDSNDGRVGSVPVLLCVEIAHKGRSDPTTGRGRGGSSCRRARTRTALTTPRT